MGNALKDKLLASSFLAAMMVAAPLSMAHAQDVERVSDDEAAEDSEAMMDTVRITGSRLNTNPNLAAANPILSVGDEEINARGVTRIEDLTAILPQVFAGQASEVSNGSTGTASLNLRGLGAVRTLTLIDGRRLPFGSSTFSPANLDLVPTQLVERVDILTGGASAVYGSDAVAGVANFILKRDFEGVELDVQGSLAQSGNGSDLFGGVLEAGGQPVPGSEVDGEELFISLTMGANSADGRGNVTVFGSYEISNEIAQDARDVSACALGSDTGEFSFEGLGCIGSGNFRLFGGGPLGNFFQEEDGTIIPFVSSPLTTFNFGPFNFFQRPRERFQIYGRGHYQLFENLELFADVAFTNVSSDAQIAPTASFGIGAYSVNCDNPFIQAGAGPDGTGTPLTDVFGCSAADVAAGTVLSGLTASHRNVEGGPRNSSLDNTAWRFVTGLRGNFLEHFDYEVFGQFARTQDSSTSTNDFVVSNLQQAFLAVDDGTGNVVCTDPSGGCVPYNIFQRGPNGESLVSQASLDFIQGVGIQIGETEQIVVGGTVQSDLGNFGIKSPLTDAGIGFLLGFEYRDDSLESVPDEITQITGGGFTGVGGATLPVSGQVEVAEVFFEAQIPLITDKPFFEELTFNGQFRHSDYETSGNGLKNSFDTNAFGLQLTWTPVEDLRLRGQFQRAVRAPNVIELFTGQDQGLPNLTAAGTNSAGVQLFDPCASSAPIATFEQCAFTGVTADQFGTILDVISGQTQSVTGGNPFLDPETSDTFTVGGVLTPRFLPGFSLSIDYFDIEVDDFISAGIGAQVILDNCLATGDAAFCDLINRAASGTLAGGPFGTGFSATNINIAELNTAGIDFQILYGFDLDDLGIGPWGGIRFDYASTYLSDFDFVPFPGADPIECAGEVQNSCPTPVNPEYRHRMLMTWDTPWDLSVTNTWRYLSSVDDGTNPTLGSESYWDLSANYALNDNVRFRAGVLNLLDNGAPLSLSSGPPLGNGNTFPTVYDTGRFIFIGATLTL